MQIDFKRKQTLFMFIRNEHTSSKFEVKFDICEVMHLATNCHTTLNLRLFNNTVDIFRFHWWKEVNKMFSPKIFFGNQLYRGHPSLITRTLKSELNITWKRPEKINPYSPEQSGDRAQYTEIDQSKISLDFQKSKELIEYVERIRIIMRSSRIQFIFYSLSVHRK